MSGEAVTGGLLAGLRVLDLTWGMPGAVATMLLCDYGAEVVKVERRVGSSATRDRACLTWDRGKSSIALDLHDAADRRVLTDLAAGADVLIEGLRPGHLAALGFGYDAVRTSNPSVVYCSISAFGSSGQDDVAGYGALAAARYGVMAESPGHRDGPIFPGHPGLDYGTAYVAAIAILAAVRARLVTGAGDYVDVTMSDGVLAQMAMNWWNERKLSYIAAKARTGALDLGHRRMLLRQFTCADGRIVQIHTGAAGGFARAMKLFALDDQISATDAAVETSALLTDRELEVLRTRLPEIFRTKTADEWLELCWKNEVACLPVEPPGTVFDDDQIRFAGVMRTVDDPELGPIEIVGPVIRFSASPGAIRGPAPLPDADGADIRARGWRSPGLPPTRQPRSLDYPLAGVRIVEFANWFASPYGNRLLSDLGADVVKVEALAGDPIRPLPDPCEGANRGKRSLAIDLKAPAAAPALAAVLKRADVIQHNLRPGVAERLGIDYETVRALNPDIVYAYAPGYGSAGPKAKLQSFAPLLSGFVGLMHLSAGPGNQPHTCFGNEDYYNGLLSATAILLALIHRERTGEGQSVESPQLHSSILATSEHYKQHGAVRSTLPALDHDQTGWGPVYRVYQCLSGWICVACVNDEHLRALVGELLTTDPELGDLSSLDESTKLADLLAERLTFEFFGGTADEWVARLRPLGVPCEIVREESWLQEFLLDDDMAAQGRVYEIEHPLHGRARVIGQIFHLREHPGVVRGRSPLLGEHSREVLADAGWDDVAVARLLSQGIIRATP